MCRKPCFDEGWLRKCENKAEINLSGESALASSGTKRILRIRMMILCTGNRLRAFLYHSRIAECIKIFTAVLSADSISTYL